MSRCKQCQKVLAAMRELKTRLKSGAHEPTLGANRWHVIEEAVESIDERNLLPSQLCAVHTRGLGTPTCPVNRTVGVDSTSEVLFLDGTSRGSVP